MAERADRLCVEGMREAIERSLRYVGDLDYDAFVVDDLRVDAVLRNISILGEAASRVSQDVREQAPNIEWSRITRSRHIIDYFGVDLAIVWRILTLHLPELLPRLDSLLDGLPSE